MTDANVLLGRIAADRPLGGGLARLDRRGSPRRPSKSTSASRSVSTPMPRPRPSCGRQCAHGGRHPPRFDRARPRSAPLRRMPFGGGGALHACAMMSEVGVRPRIVPRYPGVTSALGCVIADMRHDEVATVNLMLDGLDVAALDARMVAAGRAANAVVASSRLIIDRIDVTYELDMHYQGQTHTVAVPLPVSLKAATTGLTTAIVRTAFETAYGKAYSRVLPEIPVRIVNLRTAAIGRRPKFDLGALAPNATESVEGARRGSRQVWFDGRWHETTVWDRLRLPIGAKVAGPAVLEQPDATTVVEPNLTASVDNFGNLIMTRL